MEVVRLRLAIQFESTPITLPVNYHYLVQGWIYSMLPDDGYRKFIHDQGYQVSNQKFKLFVFSDLLGSYEIHGRSMTFLKGCRLKIGSQSEEFIEYLYQFLMQNHQVLVGSQTLKIHSVSIEELPYFSGKKEVLIKTLSPITAYRTVDRKVEYFQPDSEEFYLSCLSNLKKKAEAYDLPIVPDFTITEIQSAKKRLIRFKKTFYVSYTCMLSVYVDYPTLELMWNTGLCAKNSAGFGMIEVIRQKYRR